MSGAPRWRTLLTAAYARLLRVLPRELRAEWGGEMETVFDRLLAEASARGPFAVFAVSVRCVWGALRCAVAARVEGGRREIRHGTVSGGSSQPPVLRDLRLAVRSLRRSPAFSVLVLVLVAVGVGATTAVWSVVDNVLLRPLPYPESDRLVFFGRPSHSVPLVRELEARLDGVELLGTATTASVRLLGAGPPSQRRAALVSPGFFRLFGARPMVGRLLGPQDARAPRETAVLSYGLWQSRWGGDPGILGKTALVDGIPRTIVGVVAADFRPPEALVGGSVDLWLPFDDMEPWLATWNVHVLRVAGRLRTGVSRQALQAETNAVLEHLAAAQPEMAQMRIGGGQAIPIVALRQATVGEVSRPLKLFLGAVGLLLLIACVNVASLFLAHGVARRREVALRAALGASRRQVIWPFFLEAVLLALGGGMIGVGLAHFAVRLWARSEAIDLPRAAEITIDGRVLAVSLLVALLTGLVFGTLPALREVGRRRVVASSQLGLSDSPRHRRARSLLVVAELAMALILLAGALLLVASFLRVVRVPPGFETERLVRMRLDPGGFGSEDPLAIPVRELLERIEAVPGVISVAAGWSVPFDHLGGDRCCWSTSLRPRERPDAEAVSAMIQPVTPRYFETLRASLLQGRELAWSDVETEEGVAVVNRTLARELWGDVSPATVLGRSVRTPSASLRVVGVADDIREWGLSQEPEPTAFVSYSAFGDGLSILSLVVRLSTSLDAAAPGLRAAVWSLDSEQPIEDLETMEDRIAASIASPRFYSSLVGVFALCALVLAAGGVHGCLLHAVLQRRRELGVRMALGADRRDLIGLVLRQGGVLTLVGLGLGLGGAAALRRMLGSYLYEAPAGGVLPIVTAAAMLATIAAVACWAPARRAAATDPVVTLRVD